MPSVGFEPSMSVFRLRTLAMDIGMSNCGERKECVFVIQSSYAGDCEFYWLLRDYVYIAMSVPNVTLSIGWSLSAPVCAIQNKMKRKNYFLIESMAEVNTKI
jgi:hypothetical protein